MRRLALLVLLALALPLVPLSPLQAGLLPAATPAPAALQPAAAGAPACPAAAQPVLGQPQLSCSDCINVCLLRKCGFFEPPAGVSANLPGCRAQCASSC
jgi:hypothetical protein